MIDRSNFHQVKVGSKSLRHSKLRGNRRGENIHEAPISANISQLSLFLAKSLNKKRMVSASKLCRINSLMNRTKVIFHKCEEKKSNVVYVLAQYEMVPATIFFGIRVLPATLTRACCCSERLAAS
jgi:hypothetical protein